VRWVGGLTVVPKCTLLRTDGHKTRPRRCLVLRAHADILYGVATTPAAVPAFDGVLAAAPPAWRGHARVVDALMFSLSETGQNARALTLARAGPASPWRVHDRPQRRLSGTQRGRVAYRNRFPIRTAAIAEFENATLELVEDRSFQTARGDRSARGSRSWPRGTKRGFARGAPGRGEVVGVPGRRGRPRAHAGRARGVRTRNRLSAYMELGQVERATDAAGSRRRDLPGDYNPPARLAAAYRALKRWDEALAASDRAMAPRLRTRKLNFYEVRADIFQGRGDPDGARRTLADAIRYAEALPQEQRSATRIAALHHKLDAFPRAERLLRADVERHQRLDLGRSQSFPAAESPQFNREKRRAHVRAQLLDEPDRGARRPAGCEQIVHPTTRQPGFSASACSSSVSSPYSSE